MYQNLRRTQKSFSFLLPLLPRYYHTITTPARFMMLPASCNRRSDPCLQPSGKVIPTIRQTHPKLCPTLPKALGTCARNYRLKVLMFSGIRAHVHGHKSSCTRDTSSVRHLLPFTMRKGRNWQRKRNDRSPQKS